MPTRAYLRLDPDVRRNKIAYPDGAFRAFVELLCLADGQPRRGRFDSERVARVLLGARGRWVPWLITQGDLVLAESHRCDHCPRGRVLPGELYVDGWDEWQEGDVTVRDRVASIRERRGESTPVPGAIRTANYRLRMRVFERDNHTCRYCGAADYPRDWLVAEHVDPKGATDETNLVTACRPCNKRKGDRTPEQAGMPLLVLRDTSQSDERDASQATMRDGVRDAALASDGDRQHKRKRSKDVEGVETEEVPPAPARPGPTADTAGPSSPNLIDVERPDVAALKRRGWTHVSADQVAILDEIAWRQCDGDPEQSPAALASGRGWSADVIRRAPKGVSLLEHLVDHENALRAERQQRADAQLAAQPRPAANAGPIAAEVAPRIGPARPNGAPVSQARAIAILRPLIGTMDDERWQRLIAQNGLTDADFDDDAPDFGSAEPVAPRPSGPSRPSRGAASG